MFDAGVFYLMDEDGYVKWTIHADRESCGPLGGEVYLAVDVADNILVSDTDNRRVLLFNGGGTGDSGTAIGHRFIRLLLGQGGGGQPSGGQYVRPYGLAVDGRTEQLYVVARADNFAEVQVFVYA